LLQLVRKKLAKSDLRYIGERMADTALHSSATAVVPTRNSSRYLQQLCKHWAHHLDVEFTPEQGRVVFPRDARGADYPGDATVTFDALSTGLQMRIDASSQAQLEQLKGAVERHLDRFAFRETPLTYDWQ
jgi:uncharacterized protein